MWLRSAAAAAGLALAMAGCGSDSPDLEKQNAKSIQSEVSASSSHAAASSSASAPEGASANGSPVIVFDYRTDDADRTYYKFSTPGNAESCVISIRKGDTGTGPESSATCLRKDAQAGQQSCDQSKATGAVVTKSGARFSCDAPTGNFKTIEYGDMIEINGFKCISEQSGVTCHFAGPGFKISRDDIILF